MNGRRDVIGKRCHQLCKHVVLFLSMRITARHSFVMEHRCFQPDAGTRRREGGGLAERGAGCRRARLSAGK